MEIARRTIRIRLDPRVQRPWERKDFKHANLKGWASDHRDVWPGLTLVQNWIASGCPRFTDKTLGSYEEWAAVMGGILETSGIEGFLGNLDALYEAADSETAVWTTFVERWFERFETAEVAVEEMLELALASGLEISGDSDHARKVSLGSQLSRHRDQVVGGYREVLPNRCQRPFPRGEFWSRRLTRSCEIGCIKRSADCRWSWSGLKKSREFRVEHAAQLDRAVAFSPVDLQSMRFGGSQPFELVLPPYKGRERGEPGLDAAA